jgi:hypothetical protein
LKKPVKPTGMELAGRSTGRSVQFKGEAFGRAWICQRFMGRKRPVVSSNDRRQCPENVGRVSKGRGYEKDEIPCTMLRFHRGLLRPVRPFWICTSQPHITGRAVEPPQTGSSPGSHSVLFSLGATRLQRCHVVTTSSPSAHRGSIFRPLAGCFQPAFRPDRPR